MHVEFLGTGGYHPCDRRQTTCVLLPDRGLCFDAGTAFYRVPDRLAAAGRTELDLVLTHAHLDHVCGLTYPLVALERGTITAVRVHGRPEVLAAVRTHLFSDAVFPVLPDAFSWHPLSVDAEELEIAGGRLRYRMQTHPGGSLGLRFEANGRVFTFCTDTAADPATADFAAGSHLFAHECNFPAGFDDLAARTGHTTLPAALELAAKVAAPRTLLVHLPPDAEDADDPVGLRTFTRAPSGVTYAGDGLRVEL